MHGCAHHPTAYISMHYSIAEISRAMQTTVLFRRGASGSGGPKPSLAAAEIRLDALDRLSVVMTSSL
jgi:hypothetical protein